MSDSKRPVNKKLISIAEFASSTNADDFFGGVGGGSGYSNNNGQNANDTEDVEMQDKDDKDRA